MNKQEFFDFLNTLMTNDYPEFSKVLNGYKSLFGVDYTKFNKNEISQLLDVYNNFLKNKWVYSSWNGSKNKKRESSLHDLSKDASKFLENYKEPVVTSVPRKSKEELYKKLEKLQREIITDAYIEQGGDPDSDFGRTVINEKVNKAMEEHKKPIEFKELEQNVQEPVEEEKEELPEGTYLLEPEEIVPLYNRLVDLEIKNEEDKHVYNLVGIIDYTIAFYGPEGDRIEKQLKYSRAPAFISDKYNELMLEALNNPEVNLPDSEELTYLSLVRFAMMRKFEEEMCKKILEIDGDNISNLIKEKLEKSDINGIVVYYKNNKEKWETIVENLIIIYRRESPFATSNYEKFDTEIKNYIMDKWDYRQLLVDKYYDKYPKDKGNYKVKKYYPKLVHTFKHTEGSRGLNSGNGFCIFEPTIVCECCNEKWCNIRALSHNDTSIFCVERAILTAYNNQVENKIELNDEEFYKIRKENYIGFDSECMFEDISSCLAPVHKPGYVSNVLYNLCDYYKINISMKMYTLSDKYLFESKKKKVEWSHRDRSYEKIVDVNKNPINIKIGSCLGHIWPLVNRGTKSYMENVFNGKYGELKLKDGYTEIVAEIQKNMLKYEEDVKNTPVKDILKKGICLNKHQSFKGTLKGDVDYIRELLEKDDKKSAKFIENKTGISANIIKINNYTDRQIADMIVAIKRMKKSSDNIIMFDFETKSNEYGVQELYSWVALIEYKDGKTELNYDYSSEKNSHEICVNSFLKLFSRFYNKPEDRTIFIAHNGGKFDTSILKKELIARYWTNNGSDCSQTTLNGCIIRLKLRGCLFLDSMRFLQGSLDKNAENFKVENRKLPYDYKLYHSDEFRGLEYTNEVPILIEKEYNELRIKYYENNKNKECPIYKYFEDLELNNAKFNPRLYCILYNLIDVEVMRQVLTKFRNHIKKSITVDAPPDCENDWLSKIEGSPFKNYSRELDIYEFATISSLAFAYFEYNCVFYNIPKVSGPLLQFLQNAVTGGRVHVNKKLQLNKVKEILELVGKEQSEENKEKILEYIGSTIIDIDGVSLYPSAIYSCVLPTGNAILLTKSQCERIEIKTMTIQSTINRNPFEEKRKNLFTDMIFNKQQFVICCDIELENDWQIPQLSSYNKDDEKRIWKNGKHENIVIHSLTLESIMRGQRVKSIKVHNGIKYDGTTNHMSNYMLKLFNIRLTYKKEKNEPAATAIKLLMNSAYGKTILKDRHIKSNIQVFKSGDIETNLGKLYDYERRNRYRISGEPVIHLYEPLKETKQKDGTIKTESIIKTEFNFRNFGKKHENQAQIGVTVLAQSKRIMDDFMAKIEYIGGKLYYTDTDSLHVDMKSYYTLKQMNTKGIIDMDILGKNLTQLHDDFDDKIDKSKYEKVFNDIPSFAVKSIFGDKKCYIDQILVINKETNKYDLFDHKVFKGVNSDVLSVDDYEHLYNGGEKTIPCLGYEKDGVTIKNTFKKLANGNILIMPCTYRTIKFGNNGSTKEKGSKMENKYNKKVKKEADEFNNKNKEIIGKEFLGLKYNV